MVYILYIPILLLFFLALCKDDFTQHKTIAVFGNLELALDKRTAAVNKGIH